jgi:hypothetical protein
VGLLIGGPVEVGATVFVEVAAPSGRCSLEIAATVAHAEEGPDGRWRCGCRFATPLTADELRGLLG